MKNEIYLELGKLLKFKRKEVALTQWDVAKVLGYDSPQFISNFERGLCLPSLDSLPVLSKIYKIEPKRIIDLMVKIKELELKGIFNLVD